MISYLLNKIVGSVITLLLVSIICFFMIKLSPGDKADALLNLQGISLQNDVTSDYFDEYATLSNKLGLDRPWFYFTIESSNVISKLPENWNYLQRNLAHDLMKNKIRSENVLKYTQDLYEIEAECKNLGNENCIRELSFLYFLNDPTSIVARIKAIEKTLASFADEGVTAKIEDLALSSSLLTKRVYFYYPTISINGFDNQYHQWLLRILHLDFGVSVVDGLSVSSKVWKALKWTLLITILAFIITLLAGIPLGIYAAIHQKSKISKVIEVIMNALYAVPVFWMATMLIVFFTTPEYGSWTDIFPSPSFRVLESQNLWDYVVRNLHLMVLPVMCLAFSALPIIVRLTKRSVLSEAVNPYVNSLKAKGLDDKRIYRNHIVPNAMLPIVTLVTNSLPVALAGSLIVEIIFNIPGTGRLMYGSIQRYDWDVCFAILLLISIVTSVVLLLADIVYARLNPKIRYS